MSTSYTLVQEKVLNQIPKKPDLGSVEVIEIVKHAATASKIARNTNLTLAAVKDVLPTLPVQAIELDDITYYFLSEPKSTPLLDKLKLQEAQKAAAKVEPEPPGEILRKHRTYRSAVKMRFDILSAISGTTKTLGVIDIASRVSLPTEATQKHLDALIKGDFVSKYKQDISQDVCPSCGQKIRKRPVGYGITKRGSELYQLMRSTALGDTLADFVRGEA